MSETTDLLANFRVEVVEAGMRDAGQVFLACNLCRWGTDEYIATLADAVRLATQHSDAKHNTSMRWLAGVDYIPAVIIHPDAYKDT